MINILAAATTQPASQPTIQQLEKMPIYEIIKASEDFYSTKFNLMLGVLGILLVIIGVVIPLLIQYYLSKKAKDVQNRIDALEKDLQNETIKLKEKYQEIDALEEKLQKNVTENEERFCTLENEYKEKFVRLEQKLMAQDFHQQGNLHKSQENFTDAINSYIDAAGFYNDSGNFMQVGQMIHLIYKIIVQQANKFDEDDILMLRHAKERLNAINTNRLTDYSYICEEIQKTKERIETIVTKSDNK